MLTIDMQGQGQGPNLQGQGQGQGLDLQGQGEGQGLDSQGPGQGQELHLRYSVTCKLQLNLYNRYQATTIYTK